ncbi:MAG: hypothetical protein JSV21_10830 [Nitrospirota bacterium]|nr:MAG: hypothetical protein JSV21_10830 [Nitrospirota bacterium]
MSINKEQLSNSGGPQGPPNILLRWAMMLFCLAIVWLFIFVAAPAMQSSPMVEPLAVYINESGIDAGALYYTEIEETSEAEVYLRSVLKRTD